MEKMLERLELAYRQINIKIYEMKILLIDFAIFDDQGLEIFSLFLLYCSDILIARFCKSPATKDNST
jgi:hypothetical protein